VLEAAARAGVTVRQEAVTLEEFKGSDEAFISSTTMDIMPATVVDGKPIGSGKVGPVTRSLMSALNELIAQEIGATVGSAR
jgi:branched-subunit amino acid aminotransferase/4-amino-4-deoxychorismate lyase